MSYTYDTLGRRITKTAQNKTTKYTYANQDAIQEQQKDNGNQTTIFTRENIFSNQLDDTIATIETKGTTITKYYYEKNQLGSTVGLTNDTGSYVEQYIYDVYGKAYIKDGNSANYREFKTSSKGTTRLYTGREYESETNLYYLRARYYSPKLGRFISEDPIGIVDDINLYSYTENNPVNYTDRNGKEKMFMDAYNSYLSLETQFKEIENTTACISNELSCREVRQDLFFAEEYAKFLHYARNQFNVALPQTKQEAEEWKWYQPKLLGSTYLAAKYHQDLDVDGVELKYVSPFDGHREIIFYADGSMVTKDEYIGTYNFYSPTLHPILHKTYDMDPYFLWGNTPFDTNYN